VIDYREIEVGRHRLDLTVEDTVVVELKASKALETIHFATLVSYLKAHRRRVGLLLNFNAPTLYVRRVLNPSLTPLPPFRVSAIPCENREVPRTTSGRKGEVDGYTPTR
jgi:hypothetical protein